MTRHINPALPRSLPTGRASSGDSVEGGTDGSQARRLRMRSEVVRHHLKKPEARIEILKAYCAGKRVLDIGCVQHDVAQETSDKWMHRAVVETASYTLGVDYLDEAIDQLRSRGYNVIQGDVNKRLPIEDKFDVIVVGNLIEHLSNFDGLFENIKRLMVPGGVALISTANPFFCEQYFFSAFRNTIVVNHEHTCWIDPLTLDQLCSRFSLETIEVRWVKEKWKLADAICHGSRNALNNFTGKWEFYGQPSIFELGVGSVLYRLLRLFIGKARIERIDAQYEADSQRYLYLKAKSVLFDFYWKIRRIFVPISDINRHELFVSVLRRQE